GPVRLIDDVVELEADTRVAAHPLDLLAGGGDAVDTVFRRVVGKVDRSDVALILVRAAETAQIGARERVAAFCRRELVDDHRFLQRSIGATVPSCALP